VCRPKHVEQLRNIKIINSTTRLHLVGSSCEIYVTMHGSMNRKEWTVFYRYSSRDTLFEYKMFLQQMLRTCMIFVEEFKVPSELLQRNALRRNKLTTFIIIRGTLLVAQLVEALHYKSEGRGFDSRWCH
jgi:hypothetical protein